MYIADNGIAHGGFLEEIRKLTRALTNKEEEGEKERVRSS
jgi:hypothetical protein